LLHVLQGKVRVHLPASLRVLKAGELLSLDRGVRHDLAAITPSVVLVTLGSGRA